MKNNILHNAPLSFKGEVLVVRAAFSLIEIIIAASILSVTIFWVYKLIWENSKLINNAWNYFQLNSLFPVLEECIKSKTIAWFSSNSNWETLNFNLWNDLNWCSTWTTNTVIIDNVEYVLQAKILTKSVQFIDWEIKISGEWVWTSTGTFKLLK